MKKIFRANKTVVAFVAGLLTFAIIGTTAAAIGDVIPTFTALKIGTPLLDPVAGQVSAEGDLATDSSVIAPAGTVRAGVLKSNTLLSTAGAAGTVDVIGDLDVDGDVYGDEIGSFYKVTESCELNSCESYNTFYTLEASCSEGDYAINCNGIYDWEATWAVYNIDGLQACKLLAEKNGPLFLTAVCFNPDGSDPDAPLFQLGF